MKNQENKVSNKIYKRIKAIKDIIAICEDPSLLLSAFTEVLKYDDEELAVIIMAISNSSYMYTKDGHINWSIPSISDIIDQYVSISNKLDIDTYINDIDEKIVISGYVTANIYDNNGDLYTMRSELIPIETDSKDIKNTFFNKIKGSTIGEISITSIDMIDIIYKDLNKSIVIDAYDNNGTSSFIFFRMLEAYEECKKGDDYRYELIKSLYKFHETYNEYLEFNEDPEGIDGKLFRFYWDGLSHSNSYDYKTLVHDSIEFIESNRSLYNKIANKNNYKNKRDN